MVSQFGPNGRRLESRGSEQKNDSGVTRLVCYMLSLELIASVSQ